MSYIRREECLETMVARAIGGGDVFDTRDDDCIAAMGDALVAAANAISPGYGSRVLNVCTYEDMLFDEQLEHLRWLILRWESFSLVRRQVRGRLAAKRLLADIGEY